MAIINESKDIFKYHQFINNPNSKVNEFNQSDCEVIKTDQGYELFNTDSLCEEVELKLYQNPKTIGAIAAISCLSDFVACGVKPEFVLQSIVWDRNYTEEDKVDLQKAFNQVLAEYSVSHLGGDTSFANFTSVHTTAIGKSKPTPLSRNGAKAGDKICLIGTLGDGPALVIDYLMGFQGKEFSESQYLPKLSFKNIELIQKYFTSAIDTSDGLITALNILSQINKVQFNLDLEAPHYSQNALDFCQKHNIPKEILWICEHGDYQLLGTVPQKDIENIKDIANLAIIGEVTGENTSLLAGNEFNLENITNILYTRRHEPQNILKEFIALINEKGFI